MKTYRILKDNVESFKEINEINLKKETIKVLNTDNKIIEIYNKAKEILL